jgi:microcystin-dependent protein
MSVIKVGSIQDLSGNTDFDLINNIINTNSLNTTNINGIAASNIFVPAGTIIFHSTSIAPNGYIKANGAAVSRTTYAALFSAIGTTFGAGDGSTTFNVPDLRGYFPRGFDDGAGVDSGRTFGSSQSDAFQGHYHALSFINSGYTAGGGGVGPVPATGAAVPQATTIITDGTNGSPRITTETRPKNIALLACIKF